MDAKASVVPSQLPVAQYKDKIIELYERHQVLLIVGETGSGKTTQIPKYIFEQNKARGREGRNNMVAITQPRRVAAIALAKRVAEELGTQLGELVGYSVRFDELTSPQTRIKFVTDGMLLRELLSDKSLSRYSTIILDEAHERTLRTDILFGIVKRLLQSRRANPLKVVVMSATLNPTKFLDFFEGAAYLLRLPGRQFPVKLFYTVEPQQDYLDATVLSIFQLHLERPPGDILVFLTGQDEIEAVQRILQEHAPQCPAGASKQMAVFAPTPAGCRKIILATNIAETSLTIPGIRYVIDPGFAKMRLFTARSGMEALVITPISKASARQRMGRAGRQAPGECYRLFPEQAFKTLEEETPPEVLRSNLSNVILIMKASGIDDVTGFDYLDAPRIDSRKAFHTLYGLLICLVKRGLEELLLLGALDERGNLTDRGKLMAECPLIPVLSRALLESVHLGCSEEVIAIVAMLSADAVFHAGMEERERAAQAKRAFYHKSGDHMMLLNIYKAYIAHRCDARWCRDNFIDPRAMKHAADVRNQLVQYCEKNRQSLLSSSDTSLILRSLTAGFYMQCALKQPDGAFKTLLGRQTVAIHPSSILHGQKPDCIIYHEMVYGHLNLQSY